MSGCEDLDAIRGAKESWEKDNARQFEKERQKDFVSESGIPYKRVYTPLDLEEKGFSYTKDVSMPGTFPYTRARTAIGNRAPWQERWRVMSHGTPEESNTLWKTLLSRASTQKTLTVVYDLPCLWGYDPDDPRSEGQVGTVGVNFASLRDWEIALDGLDINNLPIMHPVSSLPSIPVAYQAAMYQQRGLDVSKMVGIVQNDVVKEYTVGGFCIFPIKHALRQNLDVLCWCIEHSPYYLPIHIAGYHQRESGLNAVQTAATCIAAACWYLEGALERGLDVDTVAPRIAAFDGGTHATFWENICIQRARRKVCAKLMRDRYGAKKPESYMIWMDGCGTGGSLAYRQEYLNNIVRSTVAALSSVLGGGGAAIVPPTEAFGVPSAEDTYFAVQASRIVFHETDLFDVVDPLGGSYFIESLTSDLEEAIWKELDAIEKNGGMLACIESGYFHRMRAEATYKWQKAFDEGEIVRVGVNRFVTPGAKHGVPLNKPYRCNPESERKRIAAVQELRRKRDNEKVKKALSDVKTTAAAEPTPKNNIMPPIIEAVKCYATMGEITGALREAWGEYQGLGRLF